MGHLGQPGRGTIERTAAQGAERCQAPQNRTRLGHRLDPELLGELADLRCRIAPVATQRPRKRKLAFLSPAAHGLGRHLQNVGHLRST